MRHQIVSVSGVYATSHIPHFLSHIPHYCRIYPTFHFLASHIPHFCRIYPTTEIVIIIIKIIIIIIIIIIITAQGNLLANNSDPTTITRNSGVFWAMNMSSSFIGNTLAFFLFKVDVITWDEDVILKIIF